MRRRLTADEQKKEIESICERTFKVNMNDKDCTKLYGNAAYIGERPEHIIESFIGDMINGTYSNGSDERMYADLYYSNGIWSKEKRRKTYSEKWKDKYEEDEKAIQNMRKRDFKIKLSDADLMRFKEKAEAVDLTPDEFLELIIQDWVYGVYANDNDDYMDKWYDRCGYDVSVDKDDFLVYAHREFIAEDIIHDYTMLMREKESIELKEYDSPEDIKHVLEYIEETEKELSLLYAEYLTKRGIENGGNFEADIKKLLEWEEEKEAFIDAVV